MYKSNNKYIKIIISTDKEQVSEVNRNSVHFKGQEFENHCSNQIQIWGKSIADTNFNFLPLTMLKMIRTVLVQ